MANTRTVVINQSNGTPMQTIETTAQTWGELQKELADNNISYSGMKAIIGETRTTMESNKALLPLEGTFNLYLLPLRTKSGSKNLNMSTKKPETKSEIAASKKKAAPSKKVAPAKKTAVAKVDTVIKKTAPISKSNLKEAASKAAKETAKEMNDVEIITNAIQNLKSVKNANVQTKLHAVVVELDDIAYIAATGKPRLDNLKSKKSACDLMQDNNLNLRKDC